jgi:hypothetical protein
MCSGQFVSLYTVVEEIASGGFAWVTIEAAGIIT